MFLHDLIREIALKMKFTLILTQLVSIKTSPGRTPKAKSWLKLIKKRGKNFLGRPQHKKLPFFLTVALKVRTIGRKKAKALKAAKMAAEAGLPASTANVPKEKDMPPETKGWLYKWTNYIKGYQKRWFVLANGLVSRFYFYS